MNFNNLKTMVQTRREAIVLPHPEFFLTIQVVYYMLEQTAKCPRKDIFQYPMYQYIPNSKAMNLYL